MEYTVIMRKDEERNWLASVPSIPGCHTWGRTKEEALSKAKEAIDGCLESLAATGDPIPEESPSLELVRLKVMSRDGRGPK